MTSLQPFLIAGSDVGLETDKKSFLLPDKAYPILENAYVWRDRTRKRYAIEKLGRLRRVFSNSVQAVADGSGIYDIPDIIATPHMTETSAMLDPFSIRITLNMGGGNETIFTDLGDGTFFRTNGTAYQITAGSYVDYNTGHIHLVWDAGGTPPNLTTVSITYGYFPSLPVMGIIQRERSDLNFEQTIWFDTVYAYIYDGVNFSEYLAPSNSATWAGSDSQFFWGANYRGSDAAVRLLFVTNFDNAVGSPMRYTDGSTWEDFVPVLSGISVINENYTLVAPWNSFGPQILSNVPVLPGTVTITVSNGVDSEVLFTDQDRDGTLTGAPSTNSGTIDYATGSFTLTISPAFTSNATISVSYQYPNTSMFTARILIPYYGRLLAFNTYEGATIGAAKQYYNRCRFSQIGDPTQEGAWLTTTFGLGGFIDAPTAESIISAIFYKNTLIVSFERSTWQLRYVGEQGLPFIWERISSDFGSESQFSNVLFDEGVLAVGNRAITAATSQNVTRIDLKIPDLIFDFRNNNEGVERVQGARDFERELVYWCYNDSAISSDLQKFPNKTLLYNYRNNTFAILRNNFTAFGYYETILGVTWDRTDIFWDDDEIKWGDPDNQTQTSFITSGNQEGYVHLLGESSVEEPSLSISAIDRSVSPIELTITNHNLITGDIIYLTEINFLDTTTSAVVTTDLNDRTYLVQNLTDGDVDYLNKIKISKWNGTEYANDFDYVPPDGTGTYIGGGEATLIPRMNIQTKDFNPFLMNAKQVKFSYIDFLIEKDPKESVDGTVTINLYSNTNTVQSGNMLVGNKQLTTEVTNLLPTNASVVDIIWNRFYANVFGQFIAVQITYNEDEINNKLLQDETFVLNAMVIWGKPGGMLSR